MYLLKKPTILKTLSAKFIQSAVVLLTISMNLDASATVFDHSPLNQTSTLPTVDYGNLPLFFETNQGQADQPVKFLARGQGYNLLLKPTEAVLDLQATPHARNTELHLRMVGANPKAAILPEDKLPGYSNYFIGNNPQEWHTEIPHYAKVHYQNLYPGIDLLYYGRQGQLEYDFVVAPGAKLKAIQLDFDNAEKLTLDTQGHLLITLQNQTLRMPKPVIYQESQGKKQTITGGYILNNKTVSFQIAAYDPNKALIIDPILQYASYLGGNNFENGTGVAVDSRGATYIVGDTKSNNFPRNRTLKCKNANDLETCRDIFIVKLNKSGSSRVYVSYFGGNDADLSSDIAVDKNGFVYVTGSTKSTNFPTTAAAFQTKNRGGLDAFVLKLNQSGSKLIYSTYFGGNKDETLTGKEQIAINTLGEAYIAGDTASTNLPVKKPLQSTLAKLATNPDPLSLHDAFVAKFNSTGKALAFATYLGGGNSDAASGITLDTQSNAYITGNTRSKNFPTKNALQTATKDPLDTILDAFVTKISRDGQKILYSTYLGGSSASDQAYSIAVDKLGNAFIAGESASTDFPVKSRIQKCGTASRDGFATSDAFVTKLNSKGNSLLYSTCLGGSSFEQARSIAVHFTGAAYIAGATFSTDFPIKSPLAGTDATGAGFIAKLNINGNALVYSSHLGKSPQGADIRAAGADDIAVDTAGTAYLTGLVTKSSSFPSKTPIQPLFGGGISDAFLMSIK